MSKIINTPSKTKNLTQIHEISQLSSLQLSMSQSIGSNLSISSPMKPNPITATLSTDIKSIYPTASDIQPNFVDQTNLLDSTIKQKIQSQHIYIQQCQPTTTSFKLSNDNIILTNSSSPNINNIQLTKSSSQIILQTQIIKLQNKCITLIGIIHQISKEYYVDLSRFGYDNIIYLDSDRKVNQSSISHVSSGSNSNSQFIYQDKDKQATEISFQQQLESFSYLENYISNYKQQLSAYQNSIAEMHNRYQKNIILLKKQIQNINKKLYEVTEQLENQHKNNKQMGKRNQELLLELDKVSEELQMYIDKETTLKNSRNLHTLSAQQNHKIRESQNKNYRSHTMNDDNSYHLPLNLNRHRSQLPQDLDISTNSKYSYMYRTPRTPRTLTMQPEITQQSFTLRQYQGCLKQMQNIIQKLTKKLQHQMKSKTNLLNEIYRLCQSINKSQQQIQQKNNKIYQLQKQILKGQSQQLKKSRQRKQVMIVRLKDNRNKKQYQNIQCTNQRYSQEINRKYQSLNKFSQNCRIRMNTNDISQGQQQMIATFNGYNQYYGTRQNQVYRPRQMSNNNRGTKNSYNYPLNKPKPSLNYAFNDYQQQ